MKKLKVVKKPKINNITYRSKQNEYNNNAMFTIGNVYAK